MADISRIYKLDIRLCQILGTTLTLLCVGNVVLAQTERSPAVLKYGDGKADGKKSIGGSGQMIRYSMPDKGGKARALRIHGARYGHRRPPDEDFEISFLSVEEILHTETAPYRLFKRGKSKWVRIKLEEELELPREFWIALDFNAEQTKGVYVSYDTSTAGKYSRVGLPGDEQPRETDFDGDWMVQILLAK